MGENNIGIKMLIILLHNSWQRGCVFLHIAGKLIQTMKHFPFLYTWPVNLLGLFEAVLCIQCIGENKDNNY